MASVLKSIVFSVIFKDIDFGAVCTVTFTEFATIESLPVAVIVTVPCDFPVTNPFWSTVATFELLLTHINVSSDVFGSIVAFICNFSSISIAEFDGAKFIPAIVAPTTILHWAVHPFSVFAVTVANPLLIPFTNPCWFTCTTLSFELVHVIPVYILADAGVITAVNCIFLLVVVSITAFVLFKLIAIGLVTTFTLHILVNPFTVFAVTVASPLLIPVIVPNSSTLAILVLLLVHVIFLFAESGVIVGVICTVLLPELKSIIISVCDNIISFGLVITVTWHFVSNLSIFAVITADPLFFPVTVISVFDFFCIVTIFELLVSHFIFELLTFVIAFITWLLPFSNAFNSLGSNFKYGVFWYSSISCTVPFSHTAYSFPVAVNVTL